MIYNTSYLNGIRILLASWVAIGHFYKEIGGKYIIDIPYASNLLLNNSPAVDGFMVITGFLMAYHYILKENVDSPLKLITLKKFWVRRFFRLYSLYFISIILAYLFFNYNYTQSPINFSVLTENDQNLYTGMFNNETLPSIKTFLLHITFLHGFVPSVNYSILPPSWSLSSEVQFYFVFPFLYLLFFAKQNRNLKTTLIVITSILVSYFSIKLLGDWSNAGHLGITFGAPAILLQRISVFIAGITIALYLLGKIKIYPLIIGIGLNFFFPINKVSTIIVFLIIFIMISEKIEKILPDFVKNMIDYMKRILSNKVADIGSNLSYSIYLLHALWIPVSIHIATIFFTEKTAIVFSFTIFILLTLFTSFLLYNHIEKPFINMGKNFANKIT